LNSNSSLFVRVAADEIEKGNFEEAISILKKGIELFENYATPYLLLGTCFNATDNKDEAENNFRIGNSLLNDSFQSNLSFENSDLENSSNFEDEQLEDLADKLKVAKIEVDHSITNPNQDSSTSEDNGDFKPLKGLVSETLASIYFDQSNYKEAKAIYKTLIDIQPERTDYFNKKIAEVESRMRS
jgi:tetratricopeptide (TPR) repeat protein